MVLLNNVKIWLRANKWAQFVMVGVLILFIGFSVARCSVVHNEREEQEAEKEYKEQHADFTSEQATLYDKYTNQIKEAVAILSNSKWVDNQGQKALFMTDKDFIERYNEKESIESYAVCTYDEETEKISSELTQTTMRMSVLTGSGDYKNLDLLLVKQGDSSSSPLIKATLESDKLFTNSTIYNRVSNSDSFAVEDWDNNANQFIGDRFDDMQTCIKDYCAKYYPQVNVANWTRMVTLDYSNHQITLPFTVKTNSMQTLTITYSQDTGEFVCEKSKTNS